MRKFLVMAILGIIVLFSGCVPSLHPLYTKDDLIFSPNLLGEWSEKNSKETWLFTKEGEKEYKLVHTDEEGKQGEFEVHLLKVKGRLFLDLFPEAPDLKENEFYQIHLLPVHTFMLVKQIEPTLQMATLSPDWIVDFLARHPRAIRHEKVEDGILLTAQSKKLQAFVIKHEKTEDAFGGLSNLTRKAGIPKE